MKRRDFMRMGVLASFGLMMPKVVIGQTRQPPPPLLRPQPSLLRHKVTVADRLAAAERAKSLGYQPGVAAYPTLNPADFPPLFDTDGNYIPHYFGPFANYANSPMPYGPVTKISVDSHGSGYTSAPTVTISDVYGSGQGAQATAVVSRGKVVQVQLTNGGSGYFAPAVAFSGGNGDGATATASIGDRLGTLTGGIRKFVDKMPGLGQANQNARGQFIPIGVPDQTSYPLNGNTPAAEYYELAVVDFHEQLHSDLPPTHLRGYVQIETAANQSVSQHFPLLYPDGTPILKPNGTPYYSVTAPHYLGVQIISHRDVPVRVKFNNLLPLGAAGNLFIPVDETVMGAGMGPVMMEKYTQNRATVHLHGAFTPWISDGTPHQWVVPAGEVTPYKKGDSVHYVPDMFFDPLTFERVDAGTTGATNNPGEGALTLYYTNQQSARLMFYHDHALGITRLGVYVGQAAGYLITDEVDQALINGTVTAYNPTGKKVLPDLGIPLILQDKTFVDPATIDVQDPNWRYGAWALDAQGNPIKGSVWLPSVYMPAQNPYDPTGASAFGRWQYGPWFWPPTENVANLPKPNEYYDPLNAPWEPPMRPIMPNPSMGMEAFNDVTMVNGCVYPYLEVEPRTYRFRILNAANDRFFNLQFYIADPTVTTSDRRTNTEVKMVPAKTTPGFPPTWSTDGRAGGVPDPYMAGPSWIQIGTEGGFLPAPVVIDPQPINWNMNATAFNVGNVTDHSLLLGCAERADVLVDFSAYAGQTLILYNDAPAAFPAIDPRYDYYTDDPDQTDTGGAPSTKAGFAPNTRTVMQIRVGNLPTNANRSVERIDVIHGGSDYVKSPRIEVTGGVGSGATATAFLAVDKINITNPGRIYTDEAIVDIRGGGGSGAAAIVQVSNGRVVGVEITNPGSGYTSAPVVTISPGPYRLYLPEVNQGGAGTTAQPAPNDSVATAVATMRVDEIVMVQHGAGYTSIPMVTLFGEGGRGSGASGQARLSLLASEVYDLAALEAVFAKTDSKTGVFETGQDPIILPQAAYNSAYNANFPGDNSVYVQLYDWNKKFKNGPLSSITLLTPGSDYTSPPQVQISGGAPVQPATAQATLSALVHSLQLVDGGIGYTSAPTVVFTGDGTGAAATATISSGVASLALLTGGTGYDAVTTVSLTGGGGSGATASATVTTGVITALTVLTRGTGYTSAPTVTLVSATGSGATASAALGGVVDHIDLTAPGSGYSTPPTISFTGGGTPTTDAVAIATIQGTVASITLTDPGKGYKSLPTVTITGGGGHGATAEAVLSDTTFKLEPKAMHDEMGAAYDLGYGRMGGMIGLELPKVNSLNQNLVLYPYASPPVEMFQNSLTPLGTTNDGTQFWKITHNGVDTHPIHVHLFNVQLINRVSWDGALLPPEPNELGWKETVRVNPLEHAIFAFTPVKPNLPFEIPNSVRLIDVTMPDGAMLMGGPAGFIDPVGEATMVMNHKVNFGWEYVWHCHILSHEEMDMMHAMAFAVQPIAPTALSASAAAGSVMLTWTKNTIAATHYVIERRDATLPANPWAVLASIPDVSGTPGTYTDNTVAVTVSYQYRVLARNTVGDLTVYAAPAVGYPHIDADSTYTNVVDITAV